AAQWLSGAHWGLAPDARSRPQSPSRHHSVTPPFFLPCAAFEARALALHRPPPRASFSREGLEITVTPMQQACLARRCRRPPGERALPGPGGAGVIPAPAVIMLGARLAGMALASWLAGASLWPALAQTHAAPAALPPVPVPHEVNARVPPLRAPKSALVE